MDLEKWRGEVSSRTSPTDDLRVTMPLQPSTKGGSGTFLAELSDGKRWWVKPQNNLQGGRVIISEFIVGKVGALIGAPVCDVEFARIPPEIVGWEFRPGHRLIEGYGSASAAVPDCDEVQGLVDRDRDDNKKRFSGVYALYDLCWGGDGQWLYCNTEDRKLYSHDHGWYLPEEGADWSMAALLARSNEPRIHSCPISDMDVSELASIADRLESVNHGALRAILNAVPNSIQVSNEDLEAAGAFLEYRAVLVAQRLRALLGGAK